MNHTVAPATAINATNAKRTRQEMVRERGAVRLSGRSDGARGFWPEGSSGAVMTQH
ncbi:hypothetical protein SCH4B_2175 [Ruegeria sp. TrichCH4B]|nr:hypothetical protein SCH4B_2175 [Ruegeria sp. TrichCH4B]